MTDSHMLAAALLGLAVLGLFATWVVAADTRRRGRRSAAGGITFTFGLWNGCLLLASLALALRHG